MSTNNATANDVFNPARWGLSASAVAELGQRLYLFWLRYRDCFRTRTRDTSENAQLYLRAQLTMETRRNFANMDRRVQGGDAQALQYFMSNSPWQAQAVFAQIQSELKGYTALAQGRPERLANYQAVKALQSEGLSLRAIAERLPINRQTVTRYARADAFPERAARATKPDPLQPFIPELLQRLAAGDVKTSELLQELRTRNYNGSDVRVYRWARASRLLLADSVATTTLASVHAPKTRPLSASRAAWLLVKCPADLKADEEATLTALQNLCPPAKLAHALVQGFRKMICDRQAEQLTEWLERAVSSGLSELRNFAVGLKRDLVAVRAALSLPWSNGRTEGHVHRLKLLKRQMYGRASFALLRKRVLNAG